MAGAAESVGGFCGRPNVVWGRRALAGAQERGAAWMPPLHKPEGTDYRLPAPLPVRLPAGPGAIHRAAEKTLDRWSIESPFSACVLPL